MPLRPVLAISSLIALTVAAASPAGAAPAAGPETAGGIDCAQAYGGKPATCRVVACSARLAQFLGHWSGPFEELDRDRSTKEKPAFRPYQNAMDYGAADCLTNPANGDSFIVGHRTDTFDAWEGKPAETRKGLVVTGRTGGGEPFLRVIDDKGAFDFHLQTRDAAADSSAWLLTVPAANGQPETRFRLTDGRDASSGSAEVRDVEVEMSIGPADHPLWTGVVTRGHHARQAG